MIGTIRTWWQNPRRRREALTVTSGLLIILALVAGYLLRQQPWRDALMALAALIAGADIALRAWNSLRHRHVSIELLVTIAAAGALVIGEYWEAAAVTFLFLFGAYLEARTLRRTRQVLQDLLEMAPDTAVVIRDGEQVEVMAFEVHQGETVLVKPGSKVPVDGRVIGGRSVVDESAITGEPLPEEKEAGASVYAGTINQAGLLKVEATGVGADTTLARIIRRVEEAQEAQAPTQRFIERFARWYTPFIILLSIGAYLLTRDIALALTLLVIGCPGALVISTPISIVAGIGRAAQRGILIKGGEYLEKAGKITALALDKTGTLTAGRPRVREVVALQPEPAGVAGSPPPAASGSWSGAEAEVLAWAAVAEAGSEHPLAGAILEDAAYAHLPEAHTFDTFTGRGVRAETPEHTIAVGTAAWLADELDVFVPARAYRHLERMKEEGQTAVIVARDGVALGIVGIADQVRASARQMIAGLRETGLEEIVMLTGDDRRTALAIAAEVGLRPEEVRAEQLPEQKLDAIRALQAKGHVVAMVGDGINDAPALAAADIGIAMGAAGTDIAIETADIALMADDLLKLPEAIRLSGLTLRNIRQNVAIALATVAFLLGGVLLGEVHMAGGMLVHEASVMVVILNGMRLLRV